MDFVANQKPQQQEMLEFLGISSVETLFQTIPESLRLQPPERDDGISEFEGIRLMESLAAKNQFQYFDNYLGAGAYEHHVPALVSAICSKSEFLTSYTPYQAEASQGMLQAIFEFQSAVSALTGMDVANASLYDGASACAEALLMAIRIKPERNNVIIGESVHPHYRAVIQQYLSAHEINILNVPFQANGQLDLEKLNKAANQDTAAILIQYPNFFGSIDAIREVSTLAKQAGALLIVCANPLIYGLYADARELGADIAVGDCQPFGLALQFGGPYAGYIACKQEFVRQLPGRLVGETKDTKGRKGFVLTLQAREQHIRREKATSNICTNQALAALASLVAMLWYGKTGIPKLALTNYQRASYLREKLSEITLRTSFDSVPIFNEFVVKFKKPIHEVLTHFRKHNIEPGVDLGRYYPSLKDHLLVAVTETKNIEQLEKYVKIAKDL